jgi:hypothetical protein
MKGYSEQRGVQSQMIFDAATGRFAQRVRVHDFELIAKSKPDQPPDATIIKMPNPKATPLSRSRRHAVMQKPEMQRAG